ncbi:MAG TPA: DUF2079 domain-containing protein [Polyangiales bacterium]|nr:DUF2079 domain-containing protein [Polyangiales bacterium]
MSTTKGAGAADAIDGREVLLSLATLALACASTWLCVRVAVLPPVERDGLLLSNTLPLLARKRWLHELLGAAGLPIVVALPWLAARRGAALGQLRRWAERLSPLCLAFTLPMLLDARLWSTRPLTFTSILLVVVLLLEQALGRALGGAVLPQPSAASGWARWLPLLGVVVCAAAYTAYMSHFSIMRHQRFVSAGFDLGIFDNLMVNALEGRPFHSSVAVPKGSYLSNHAEFGMYLFLPVYALWPRAETLLILQSAFMGFAAVPLYAFAATRLPRMAAALLSVAYLMYAPLHGPNFFDFHWMPLSMLFFFWLFYAIERRQKYLIGVLSVVICLMREDAPFGLIATGLFLIATGHWPRLGGWLTVLPSAWFVIVKFVIMPLAGPWWFSDIYRELIAPGEKGYGSVVRTIVINPSFFVKTLLTEAKLTYALHLFAPLALLPLRGPGLWLLALPGFVVTLMTTGYAPTTSISFQYTTHWIPFLFGATVLALARRDVRPSLLALCFGVICHTYVFGAILQRDTFTGGFNKVEFSMSKEERQRYADLRALAARIPARASVAATEQEVPHVSNRPNVYTLKIGVGNAEYVLVNRRTLFNEARRHFQDALGAASYDLVARQGDYVLFRRGPTSPAGREALRALRLTVPDR